MTAVIAGTVTRVQAGLVKPRSRSSNITPENGGSVTHWGGTRQHLGDHERCKVIWRSWQRYHMSPGGLGTTNGAADIAYNFGYCNHGYVFVGRGWGVRSGANGTSHGNQNYYAFVWIGGIGDGDPTEAALNALDWLVKESRLRGAGDRVRPHQDFTGSTCSGPDLIPYTRNHLDQQPIASPDVRPDTMETEMTWRQAVRQWAMELGLTNGKRPKDPITREEMWATIQNYDETIDGDFLRDQKKHLAILADTHPEGATDGSALRRLIEAFRG